MSSDNYIKFLNRELKNHPMIPFSEEVELINRYKETGDIECKNKVILSKVRLVLRIVKETREKNQNMDSEDLFQEGFIALNWALEKFDVSKNIRFSTYATIWIKSALSKRLIENYSIVKMPRSENYRKLYCYLIDNPNTDFSIDKLQKQFHARKEAIENIMKLSRGILSLDMVYENVEFYNFVGSCDIEENLLKKEEIALLRKKLLPFKNRINDVERSILNDRILVDREDKKSCAAIAKVHNLTGERIRQIERTLIPRFNKYIHHQKMIANSGGIR